MSSTSKNTQFKGKGTTRPSQPLQASSISSSSSGEQTHHQGTGQDPSIWSLPPSPPRTVVLEIAREGTGGGRGQGGREGSRRGPSQSVNPSSVSSRQSSRTSSQPLEWTVLPSPPSPVIQHSFQDTSGPPDWMQLPPPPLPSAGHSSMV
ncbi:hypothetical protein AcV5_009758 [Taiwanofungus camphoratus]|nr:hypothetical protein AcV5_009758 [Antrodia cinnamomea]